MTYRGKVSGYSTYSFNPLLWTIYTTADSYSEAEARIVRCMKSDAKINVFFPRLESIEADLDTRIAT